MGDSPGQLCDISESGARVRLVDPPRKGSTALLAWDNNKKACTVIWSSEDECGVAFDEPLSSGVIQSMGVSVGDVVSPIASIGNIPMGRRRSRDLFRKERPIDAINEVSSGVVALSRRRKLHDDFPAGALTAAEEMFFYGSPLSHVIAYEAYLRNSR